MPKGRSGHRLKETWTRWACATVMGRGLRRNATTLTEVVSEDVESMEDCIRGKLSQVDNRKSTPHRFRYVMDMQGTAYAAIGVDTGDYITHIDPLDVVGIGSERLLNILVHEIVHHILTVVEPDPDREGNSESKRRLATTTIDS